MLSQMGRRWAVSLLCQDQDIFIAAMMASTPCPLTIRGKIVVGRRAYLIMKQNPSLYLPTTKSGAIFTTPFWAWGLKMSMKNTCWQYV